MENENYKYIEKCHKGIQKYIDEMLPLIKYPYSFDISNEIVDSVLGIWQTPNVILVPEIEETLVFDDFYGKKPEVNKKKGGSNDI